MHKPPGVIEELSDDFIWASVQILKSCPFRVFKFYFVHFLILSFAPPPVLCDLKHQNKQHSREVNVYHLDWIKLTVELWKEHTQMSLSSDGLLEEWNLRSEIFLLAEEVSYAVKNPTMVFCRSTWASPSTLESSRNFGQSDIGDGNNLWTRCWSRD